MIQVFFGFIIGGEEEVFDYDFVPVNIGFGIACVAAFYQLAYHIYLGKKTIIAEEEEDREERKTAYITKRKPHLYRIKLNANALCQCVNKFLFNSRNNQN